MHFNKVFRASVQRLLAVFLIIAVLLPAPAFALDSDDSQIFITGFNAYQKKDYKTAIDTMSDLLKKYPDTPLKDMAIFWLARANYKAGNNQEAAKYMSQFFREYPDSPLRGTVEEGLVSLADRYQKGEPIEAPAPVVAKAPAPEQSAAEKLAAEKAAAEKFAAEKAATAKLAAEKAAAEKTVADKAAAELAAAERLVAEKTAAEKAAAENAAAEQAAAQKLALERAAAEKAAAEKAAAEKLAQEKAAAEKAASEKVVAERAAAEKAAAEQAAAQKAAAEQAAVERMAAEKAAADQVAAARKEGAVAQAKSASLRDQAIEAYKAVVDKYPGTPAAASASAKLNQLGIAYPQAQRAAAPAPQGEVSQVFNLEVAQYPDLDILVGPVPETEEAGRRFSIPFEVVNTGNGSDSFSLESGFPVDFDFHFAAAARPEVAINATPSLPVGARFKALAVGSIPRGNIDGQRNVYPIKAVSAYAKEVSQSKEITLVTSAPMLRAVVKNDKTKLLPGEKVSYRISLLNIGTAAAHGVTLRLSYPPQYEPTALPAGFRAEGKGALVLDSLQLKSGESTDYSATFQLKDEALADQELFLRADVVNGELDKKESFVSATSVVQRISGVTARTTADKLVVIPGQVVSIPIVVTNTGNTREVFSIKANIVGSKTYAFFEDSNRDGKRQITEPIINHVGPLSPKEESYIILEVATPATAPDGSIAPMSVSFEPENAVEKAAAVHLQLTYSRPILELAMAAKNGRLKPGEVASLELDCFNRGSNMAKQVVLQSVLPPQMELVAADPAFTKSEGGVFIWRFDELGAGEKRSIKISYRVKPGIAVGTNMQMKNLLNYQDQLGNRY